MAMIDRNFTFATNGTVSAADLHNLIDSATIYQDLITGQLPITSVGTNYELLIADGTNPNAAPNAVTVYDLFEDALTAGTYTNANISAALTYGTATGTRLVSTNATITTGTITTAVIPTLTAGTTTSTAATITSGTITNLASTTGTIATLNSTTGTIGNLSTTLAGEFTISSGTGTLGTTGVTAGTYGSASAIPFLTVDAKGRITSATSGTFSTVPADGSITPAKLSQPFTSGTAVTSTSGTAIDFTGIPSWVKRITVMLNGVSTSGTNNYMIQFGYSGGVETSGYAGSNSFTGAGGTGGAIFSTGLGIASSLTNVANYSGQVVLTLLGSDIWVASSFISRADSAASFIGTTTKTMTGTLDRIRLTTVGGTDTFDAGSVNIMYEG